MPASSQFPFLPDTGSPSAPAGRRPRPVLKAVFFFLSLVAVIAFVRLFDLQSVLDPAWADSHLDFSAKSVLLYLGLAAVLSPLGIPRQALAALGGYAFGAAYGSLFASIGLVFGCSAGFFYARFLARSALRQRFGKGILRLEAFLSRNPFAMTMAIRFFPMGNNALLNLAAGLTTIPAAAFIAGSGIGYLPQTIIFALLGSGIRIDPVWRTAVSALLFIIATGLGYLLYRKFRLEQAGPGAPAEQHSQKKAAEALAQTKEGEQA